MDSTRLILKAIHELSRSMQSGQGWTTEALLVSGIAAVGMALVYVYKSGRSREERAIKRDQDREEKREQREIEERKHEREQRASVIEGIGKQLATIKRELDSEIKSIHARITELDRAIVRLEARNDFSDNGK